MWHLLCSREILWLTLDKIINYFVIENKCQDSGSTAPVSMFLGEAVSRKRGFLRLIQEFVLDSQAAYCRLFLLGRDLGFKFKLKLHFMVSQRPSGVSTTGASLEYGLSVNSNDIYRSTEAVRKGFCGQNDQKHSTYQSL